MVCPPKMDQWGLTNTYISHLKPHTQNSSLSGWKSVVGVFFSWLLHKNERPAADLMQPSVSCGFPTGKHTSAVSWGSLGEAHVLGGRAVAHYFQLTSLESLLQCKAAPQNESSSQCASVKRHYRSLCELTVWVRRRVLKSCLCCRTLYGSEWRWVNHFESHLNCAMNYSCDVCQFFFFKHFKNI